MKKVLLLLGGIPNSSAGATLTGENSYLKTLLEENASNVDLTVLSFGFTREAQGLNRNIMVDTAKSPALDRLLTTIGAGTLYARLATFPIGRLINSVGPLDQGRVFWRRLRRDSQALEALKRADVIVAADLAAVKTAWIASKRGWCSHAEYDTRACGLGLNFAVPDAADEQRP